jgi:hypothetical protein
VYRFLVIPVRIPLKPLLLIMDPFIIAEIPELICRITHVADDIGMVRIQPHHSMFG